jgi:hypothetical protein
MKGLHELADLSHVTMKLAPSAGQDVSDILSVSKGMNEMGEAVTSL